MGKRFMTVEDLARICHEANRVYCQTLGDNSQKTWAGAPQWQRDSAINGVRLHLLSPVQLGASASHENWMKEKINAGWKHGPKKDAKKLEHPCLVPFHELPEEQQMKDVLFAAIVRTFAHLTPNK